MAINEQDKITVPFANSGLRNDIPETATGSNLASMQEGFPAVTMTDIASGGQPPDGKDFNGILNVITKILQYTQSGGLYKYDSDYATAMGGYPVGAILRSADGQKIWLNTTANNSSDPDNGGQNWVALTDASSLASALSAYLPKSGGTMSGTITTSTTATLKASTNNSFISLQGSSTGWNNGAQVTIYGENNSGPNAGGVQLIARKTINGSIASSTITLNPDGSIVLNNNGTQSDILTSASTLDASKLNVSYLPTAGGTATGTIGSTAYNSFTVNGITAGAESFKNVITVYDTNLKRLFQMRGGCHADGERYVSLTPFNETDGFLAGISLGIKNGSQYLKYGSSDVLTTSNGLPLSGGTMTGSIQSSISASFVKNSTTSYLGLSGGTAVYDATGANLLLYGRDVQDNGGSFFLRTVNSQNQEKSFVGKPNGILSWGGKNILREDTLCTTQPTTTSTASASNPAVVVENYYDSTTGDWYSVRSDGWVEQGGVSLDTANAQQSIDLNYALGNTTDYKVMITPIATTNADFRPLVANAGVGSFTVYNYSKKQFYWEVKGYKAS